MPLEPVLPTFALAFRLVRLVPEADRERVVILFVSAANRRGAMFSLFASDSSCSIVREPLPLPPHLSRVAAGEGVAVACKLREFCLWPALNGSRAVEEERSAPGRRAGSLRDDFVVARVLEVVVELRRGGLDRVVGVSFSLNDRATRAGRGGAREEVADMAQWCR